MRYVFYKSTPNCINFNLLSYARQTASTMRHPRDSSQYWPIYTSCFHWLCFSQPPIALSTPLSQMLIDIYVSNQRLWKNFIMKNLHSVLTWYIVLSVGYINLNIRLVTSPPHICIYKRITCDKIDVLGISLMRFGTVGVK